MDSLASGYVRFLENYLVVMTDAVPTFGLKELAEVFFDGIGLKGKFTAETPNQFTFMAERQRLPGDASSYPVSGYLDVEIVSIEYRMGKMKIMAADQSIAETAVVNIGGYHVEIQRKR